MRLQPEPWLRGNPQAGSPALAQVLYTFTQAVEDLEHFTAGFSDAQLWMRPHGLGAVGFHIKHILGSVDRLLTYAEGGSLTEGQMAALRAEHEGKVSIQALRDGLAKAAARVRAFEVEMFDQPRTVGREKLPTTVIGLLIHIAEHTQRHAGQAVVTARLVRSLEGMGPAE